MTVLGKILYQAYVNMDRNMAVCGEATDAAIIAQLKKNNQAEDYLGIKRTRKYIREALPFFVKSYGAHT